MKLEPRDRELLGAPHHAWVVTLRPDGSPHASLVWVEATEDHVLVNTAEGRVKDRNLRADPRVLIAGRDEADPYRWVSVEGGVVERVVGPEAEAHIDRLSRAYDGQPWSPVPGQVRVLYRIAPRRIVRYA